VKTSNGTIILDDTVRFTVSLSEYSQYVDSTEMRIVIPNSLIVRLYESLKHTADKQHVDFDNFCNSLFNKGN
jgi:hypothetical protein